MNIQQTYQRPPTRLLIVVVLALLALAGAAAADPAPSLLEIGRPFRAGEDLVADVKLHGMFNDETMATLRSGLPVNLVFSWSIWQEKSGWRDDKTGEGQIRFRIYFDMLEEDYNIFNAQGRPLATCEALVGVESVVCDREGLVLADAREFSSAESYYVEMEARIEAVADQQVRGFESWLLGQEDESQYVPVGEKDTALAENSDDSGLASGLSGFAMGLIKGIAGIDDRTVTGQSPVFRGW